MEKSIVNFVMETVTLICGIVIIGFIFFAAAPAKAQVPVAKVVTIDGKKIVGDYVTKNDSAVVLRDWDRVITVPYTSIDKMLLQGETFVMRNGEFVKFEKPKTQNGVAPGDPVYSIGKAFQSTGGAALGIGVPCLVTGVICMAIGKTGVTLSNSIEKGNLSTAGSILLPVGASLTIIGIPLTIHGKRIMEMNITTTGNSAGLALVF